LKVFVFTNFGVAQTSEYRIRSPQQTNDSILSKRTIANQTVLFFGHVADQTVQVYAQLLSSTILGVHCRAHQVNKLKKKILDDDLTTTHQGLKVISKKENSSFRYPHEFQAIAYREFVLLKI
jgi:hypothetical protein